MHAITIIGNEHWTCVYFQDLCLNQQSLLKKQILLYCKSSEYVDQ